MRTVQYEPSTLRRWHDGPVVVLDTKYSYDSIDTHLGTYLSFISPSAVRDYLNIVTRPFAGTFYVIASRDDVAKMAQEFSDLDIVHLTV